MLLCDSLINFCRSEIMDAKWKANAVYSYAETKRFQR